MADEPSRPKLRLTERPPAPAPAPAAPSPTPERVFRAPALPVPEAAAVKLPPPPPPAAGRPAVRAPASPASALPPAAPAPAERSSVLPLVGALACVVGAALFYTQVLRPRREAREAAAGAPPPAVAPAAPSAAAAPETPAPAVLERADPGAGPEFRARVLGLRLSGVFAGEPARAMIDGRLVRAGEVIDERLGLRFDGLEPGGRLRFRDASGATVVRKY